MIGPMKTVGIYVQDQEKALDFYTQKMGFELRRSESMGPKGSWIEVAPPGAQTCVVLYPKALMADWEQRRPCVVFHCPDVEAACRRLESLGVRITMQPKPMAWGTFAMFADLDGNEFGLTSQRLA